MIISIHIPKTAGMSFGQRLNATFGSRLLLDYGDQVGYNSPEAEAQREKRWREARDSRQSIMNKYDVIHGHFVADKYADLFPRTHFVAFFRDPYQQAVSHYRFLLRQNPAEDEAVRAFHAAKLSVPEFVAALRPGGQSIYLGRVPLERFTCVATIEEFNRGVALFEAVFGCALAPAADRENVNPDRTDERYEIDLDVRKAVDLHWGADVALYRHVCEMFGQLAAKYGV